jgi:hypothetical protein
MRKIAIGVVVTLSLATLGPALAGFGTFFATLTTTGKTITGSGIASSVRTAAGRYEVKFKRPIEGCAIVATVNGAAAGYGVTRKKAATTDTVQLATFNKSGVLTDSNTTLLVTCNN